MSLRFRATDIVSGPLCAALHTAGFPEGQGWDEEFFTKMLALPTTRGELAISFDMPVGFILWQQGPDMAEIYTLVVLPGERRKGIAEQLLARAEAAMRADATPRALLDVAIDNLPAHALYSRHDYKEIARRPGYYSRTDGAKVDAIVMEKFL